MLKDLGSFLYAGQDVNPQSLAAGTHNGAGVNTVGFNSALALINIGALGGGTAVAQVDEYDEVATSWAAIESTRLRAFGGALGATALSFTSNQIALTENSLHRIAISDVGEITKTKLRVTIVVTGGSGALASVSFLLGNPVHAPDGKSVYIS